MKPALISASLVCMDFFNLQETLRLMEESGIEYLHVDIMDGEFVQNFALCPEFCESLRKHTSIPLDIHLMIKNPELKIHWFHPRPGEYISVHAESTPHIPRALAEIRRYGARPMIALNPGTPIHMLDYVLDDIDGVLVMTVNPGFSGQKMVPATLEKIAQVRAYLDERGRPDVDIQADGNVSFENAVKMRRAGANIFVGGTSSIFSQAGAIRDNIQTLRTALK